MNKSAQSIEKTDTNDFSQSSRFYRWADITGTKTLVFKLIDVKNGEARFETFNRDVIMIYTVNG
jgi:hypothetical protein